MNRKLLEWPGSSMLAAGFTDFLQEQIWNWLGRMGDVVRLESPYHFKSKIFCLLGWQTKHPNLVWFFLELLTANHPPSALQHTYSGDKLMEIKSEMLTFGKLYHLEEWNSKQQLHTCSESPWWGPMGTFSMQLHPRGTVCIILILQGEVLWHSKS